MKPIKLAMSAFGPYAHEECIDFSNLKDKNIFLITGPTGAGKTTIFDAISYALFGEASGSSRENDSLRSHFALQEVLTYVELEFELKGQTYKVKRYPKQERKKARGEGFTIKESDAELTMPDGSLVVRVNSVDEKINSLLGINKNQFRQIVMLPQGEFRKLLEAESKEREVIFRKIFGTEAFQFIQIKLDYLQKEYYKGIKNGETKRATHIKHLQPGEDELLTKLINAENLNIIEITNRTGELILKDDAEDNKLAEEIEHVKLKQEKTQHLIAKGEETNKKLDERDKLIKLYSDEQSKEALYTDKQRQLERGRKAAEVRPLEDALKDREKNLELRREELKSAEQVLVESNKAVELSLQNLKLQQEKELERNNIAQAMMGFKDKEERVKSYEAGIDGIAAKRQELKAKKDYLDKYKVELERNKKNLQSLSKTLMEIKNFEVEKVKLSKAIEDKNTIIKELRLVREKIVKHLEYAEEHAKQAKFYSDFEKEYIEIKNQYDRMNERFLKGQAGILAEGLTAGTECPVCGSTDHPRPAVKVEGVPSEEALNIAKAVHDEKLKEKNDRLSALTDANTSKNLSLKDLEETKERLKDIVAEDISSLSISELRAYINERGPKLKAELDELNTNNSKLDEVISHKSSVEADIAKNENQIKLGEIELPKLETEYMEYYSASVSEEEKLKNIEKEIPEDIRSTIKLSTKINQLQIRLNEIEKAYKDAQENYNKALNKAAYDTADKEAKVKNIESAVLELDASTNNLNKKIGECGFLNLEDYTVSKMSAAQIDSLSREISKYNEQLRSLKDAVEKSSRDTEGLSTVSIDELISLSNILKQEESVLVEKEKLVYSRIKNNKNVLMEIENINKEISKDEEKYNVIRDLSRAANGDNDERITFERYVLAAYFDEIIGAANLRLNKMAGGRFVLKRKDEKGKGQKQEGLELEVFDNYTGRARHVKTLSGGESFKASLALALGLADVVQSYAGGISLDTIFVDEGFGTLDPESLDNAIQCLIDLKNGGRLVGIISHVPELKERIDARLEVTPAKEGSRAKFIL